MRILKCQSSPHILSTLGKACHYTSFYNVHGGKDSFRKNTQSLCRATLYPLRNSAPISTLYIPNCTTIVPSRLSNLTRTTQLTRPNYSTQSHVNISSKANESNIWKHSIASHNTSITSCKSFSIWSIERVSQIASGHSQSMTQTQWNSYVTQIFSSVVPDNVRAKKALWIGSVYRLPFLQFVIRPFFPSLDIGLKMQKKIVALLDEINGPNVDFVQRFREGGVMLYFETEEARSRAQEALKKELKSEKIYKVKGTPYVDDLLLNSISSNLNVEFETETMNVLDHLYVAFRHYGRISSIDVDKKAKKASINFVLTSDATSAKNCLHGAIIFGAVLMVEPFRLLNVIQKLAGKSTTSFVELEDTRKVIEDELSRRFSESAGSIYFVTGSSGSGKSTMIQNIVNRRKNAVVISCLKGVDSNSNDESHLIERLEEGLHFTPSFHFVNSVISYIEAFLPKSTNSMTSNKLQQLQNILRTLENSLRIISTLYPTDPVRPYPYSLIVFDQFHELIQVLEYSDDKAKAQLLFDTVIEWAVNVTETKTANVVFVCDNPLAIETFNRYKEVLPKCWKIQIGDLKREDAKNFFRKQMQSSPILHAKQLREKEAENKKAAIEDAVEESMNSDQPLPDISSDASVSFSDIMKYVWWKRISRILLLNGTRNNVEKQSRADITVTTDEVDHVVDILGGRLSDLVSLAARLSRNPDSIDDALDDIIFNTRSKILKDGFGEKYNTNNSGRPWTHTQLWKVMRTFRETESMSYENVLFKVLDGDDASLKAMIHQNLLAVEFRGEEYFVSPQSPLYRHIFSRLVEEEAFFKKMTKLCKEEEEGKLSKEMKEYQEEMKVLSNSNGEGVSARYTLLNCKLKDATERYYKLQDKYKKIEKEFELRKKENA